MKRIKVLGSVLKRTRADKIIIGFIVFIFAVFRSPDNLFAFCSCHCHRGSG